MKTRHHIIPNAISDAYALCFNVLPSEKGDKPNSYQAPILAWHIVVDDPEGLDPNIYINPILPHGFSMEDFYYLFVVWGEYGHVFDPRSGIVFYSRDEAQRWAYRKMERDIENAYAKQTPVSENE